MTQSNCVIIGASHAGTTLALQLRREGWEGSITLISAEAELPYHRPPLSKDLLAGEKDLDAIRLRPAKAFADNNIDLILGAEVTAIDKEQKQVQLSDGRALDWSKLVLCTGARVRKIPLGGSLRNIFYIRSHDDTAALAEQLVEGRRAVVIGAGYIGLEAAAVMAQKGVQVTVLEMADRVLQRVTSEPMSKFMTALHQEHGVKIVTSAQVTDIQGDGVVDRVVCEDGSEYEADFVIVGVGVIPQTELAQQAGVTIEGGVLVDEYAQTNVADIFAAGDCTVHPSAIYQRAIRLESVQNANDQARVVAANICGKQKSYDAVPWFWSDQYTTKLQMVGLSEGFDELVVRGDSSNATGEGFALFYLLGGVLIAADCVSRPKEFMVAKRLVKDKVRVSAALLQDDSVEPVDFIA